MTGKWNDPVSLYQWKQAFLSSADPDERDQGLWMLLQASDQGVPEAQSIVADLLLMGVARTKNGSSEEYAMGLLRRAANAGFLPARSKLNGICEEKYRESVPPQSRTTDGRPAPLRDFEGEPIKIDRKGVLTPVDAQLECRDGRNLLTLSANVYPLFFDETADDDRLMEAVYAGIKEWEGCYRVFGDQELELRIVLTNEDRFFDSVVIVPVTEDYGSRLRAVAGVVGTKKKKRQLNDVIDNKRSFAGAGIKWSVYSRKFIFIQSKSGRFDEYEEIQAVAKHEFGHILGLGDLYASAVDSLPGVDRGTYRELDGYYISDNVYNLVMCDQHGPISNNDIEMVILAFRDNKAQLYQPGQLGGRISGALGKGN